MFKNPNKTDTLNLVTIQVLKTLRTFLFWLREKKSKRCSHVTCILADTWKKHALRAATDTIPIMQQEFMFVSIILLQMSTVKYI